jgi:2-amino-4-hydroxy-6-hydroxymethyldihydropteridine diphosphokinase
MIFIGLGANLPGPGLGDPRQGCEAALLAMDGAGIMVVRCSRWYRSAPVPESDQPWFVNGVAEVETAFDPPALLAALHRIEADLGRTRHVVHGPRVIDLDLLAYGTELSEGAEGPVLPHPRLHERAFVLLPLRELAPGWRHPRLDLGLGELIAGLPAGQHCEPLDQGLIVLDRSDPERE